MIYPYWVHRYLPDMSGYWCREFTEIGDARRYYAEQIQQYPGARIDLVSYVIDSGVGRRAMYSSQGSILETTELKNSPGE